MPTPFLAPGIRRSLLPLASYELHARMADVALWEPRNFTGRVIAAATDGPWCHATGVLKLRNRLYSAGYEEKRDGFLQPLEACVKRWPNMISVFRSDLLDDRADIVGARMLDGLTGEYAWGNIRAISVGNAILFRMFRWLPIYRRWIGRASRSGDSAICSQFVARSYRQAGAPLLRKFDAIISPNDLALSERLHYLGTLIL